MGELAEMEPSRSSSTCWRCLFLDEATIINTLETCSSALQSPRWLQRYCCDLYRTCLIEGSTRTTCATKLRRRSTKLSGEAIRFPSA